MHHKISRTLVWPGYLFALMLILFPMADLVVNVWPARLGNVQWRYGTVGLLSGMWLTPLFGMAFLLICAAALEHRWLLRVLGVLNVVVAVLLTALLVFFVLDWLQVRSTIPLEGRASMDVGSTKAVLKHILVTGLMAWLGGAAWIAGRPEHRSRHSTPPLIRETGAER